ncbi:MAG: AgmX/PglI C-terminal domain-containing protein [Deltaproteobacteria bacterium]|nr:AgmX/PglI C-terminal domain-containing protein [Deltaproteobacteria bacterium]
MRRAGIVFASLVLLAVGLYMFYIQVQDLTNPGVYDADNEVMPDNRPADLAIEVKPDKPDQLDVAAIPVNKLDTAMVDDAPGEEDDPTGEQLKAWDKKMGSLCVKLVKQKKLSQARDCLLLQLAQNPDNPKVNLHLGIVAAMRGDTTEAYHRYVKYLELDPNGMRAPMVQRVLDQYDAVQMDMDNEMPDKTGETGQDKKHLLALEKYRDAYRWMKSDPHQALPLMKQALVLVPPSADSLRESIQRHIADLEEKISSTADSDPKTAKEDLPETLNKRQIAEKLINYLPQLKRCAVQQRRRNPDVRGIMLVSFLITGNGRTKDVRIITKEHADSFVAGCVTFVIKQAEFPKFSGKPIEVPRLPLKLSD